MIEKRKGSRVTEEWNEKEFGEREKGWKVVEEGARECEVLGRCTRALEKR